MKNVSLDWDVSMSCYDDHTDLAHQEIFDRYKKLLDCLSDRKDAAEIKSQSIYLVDYMIEHFHEENLYMKKVNYPDAIKHIKEHAKYIKTMSDFLLDIAKNPNDPLSHLDLLVAFSIVITQHIKKADIDFANYMQKKGEPINRFSQQSCGT